MRPFISKSQCIAFVLRVVYGFFIFLPLVWKLINLGCVWRGLPFNTPFVAEGFVDPRSNCSIYEDCLCMNSLFEKKSDMHPKALIHLMVLIYAPSWSFSKSQFFRTHQNQGWFVIWSNSSIYICTLYPHIYHQQISNKNGAPSKLKGEHGFSVGSSDFCSLPGTQVKLQAV